MRTRRLLLPATTVAALAVVLTVSGRAQTPAPPAPPLLLANASVVDVASGEIRRGQFLVLRDGRIASIGATAPPAGTAPVDRVFSNRADANHRYMTDRALRDQMVASGWLAEGDGPDLVVMCAPG